MGTENIWLIATNGLIALGVVIAGPVIVAKLNLIHTTVNSNLAAKVQEVVVKEREIGDLRVQLAAMSVEKATLVAAMASAQEPSKH